MQDITNKLFQPITRHITKGVEHELWHQRLCHAGEKMMSTVHKCADGVPDLQRNKHFLYKCKCCMKGKVKAAVKNKSTMTIQLPPEDNNFIWILDLLEVKASLRQITKEK